MGKLTLVMGGERSNLLYRKPREKRRRFAYDGGKMDLISDFLILAEAVQKVNGNVVYECPYRDVSWRCLGDGF